MYGLKCGLFRIALHLTGRAAMHLVVPNLTEQDCVVLDSTAVSCSGLDGTRPRCYGLHCSALHLTGLDSTAGYYIVIIIIIIVIIIYYLYSAKYMWI